MTAVVAGIAAAGSTGSRAGATTGPGVATDSSDESSTRETGGPADDVSGAEGNAEGLAASCAARGSMHGPAVYGVAGGMGKGGKKVSGDNI